MLNLEDVYISKTNSLLKNYEMIEDNRYFQVGEGKKTPHSILSINYAAAELRGMNSCLRITLQSRASRNISYSD